MTKLRQWCHAQSSAHPVLFGKHLRIVVLPLPGLREFQVFFQTWKVDKFYKFSKISNLILSFSSNLFFKLWLFKKMVMGLHYKKV